MQKLFFDDIEPGYIETSGSYRVDPEEMLEFNRKWDPLPIHLDENAAHLLGHKGIIASGQYTLCIKQYFVNQSSWRDAVIGTTGWDEVRFRKPIYGNDTIYASIRCVEKTPSRSKPDRGVVRFEIVLTNQDNEIVFSFLDNVMLERRARQ